MQHFKVRMTLLHGALFVHPNKYIHIRGPFISMSTIKYRLMNPLE